ncbi:MAG: alanine/glycine:cation symporter family protein, partial [Muribaculaceae bacterium]
MDIEYWIQHVTDIVCGYPLFILLIGGGLFLFVYSGALPLRKLRMAFDSLHVKHCGEGSVSSFQALMTTISSTVGMGNIAGVAIALCVGGPGAIFWMWVSAILGMATKFFEGTLAIMYKGKDGNGVAQGGPMHVLVNGISPKMKPLAIMFSAATLVGCLVLMQANQLTDSLCQVCIAPLGISTGFTTRLIVGIAIGAIVSCVIFGGLKRIAQVATRIVPFMVGFYFVMVFGVMIVYADRMPGVFADIINGAFCWEAGFGAMAGVAMTGARRAMFVNEAGVGTAGMMHGASMNAEPVREGLVAMLGPVIDSGLVCTLSAIPMIMAGMYRVE